MAGAGQNGLKKANARALPACFFKMAAWIIRRSGALQTT
jgi:hypothetical protein